MFRRVLADVLGVAFEAPPEPESVVLLRTWGAQLTDAAGSLRAIAARARLLNARADDLRIESTAWERRLSRAKLSGDQELIVAAAKMAGRVQGQLQSTTEELGALLDKEIASRETLVEQRGRWLRALDQARKLRLDLSSCVTTIDLQAPPPSDNSDLPDDEEREFVGRIIDGMHVH